MSEWHEVDQVNGGPWSAWRVQVCLGTMPDRTVAPIGLRIEPRDDYEGSIRDQRITLDRLRQFPLGWATVWARIDSFGEQPASEAFGLIDRLLAEAINKSRAALAQQEIRSAERELKATEERLAAAETEILQKYRDLGWTDRQIRLNDVARHYESAQRNPRVPSPRRYVAEKLNISLTTVDRLLREARKDGHLPPYDGNQGKHGKPAPQAQEIATEGGPNDAGRPRQRRSRASTIVTSAAAKKADKVQRSAEEIDRRNRRGE